MDIDAKSLVEFADRQRGTEVVQASAAVEGMSGAFADIPIAGGARQLVSLKKLVDEWRTAPERREGIALAHTLDSFIDLVNRHKDGDSAIFADFLADKPSLLAVIDYHTIAGEPRFCRHRVGYEFPLSDEFKAWSKGDGEPRSQTDWAAFIEDRVAELASPMDGERAEFERLFHTNIGTPAEILTLSRGMAINVESRVKEVRVLQSGEAEIQFEETHKDAHGAKLLVPGLFVISVPLFLGDTDPRRFVARLRYRRAEGRIVWFYQIYRLAQTLRAALTDAADRAGGATALPVYEGQREATLSS